MKTFRMMAIAGCMAVVASGCSSDEPKAESGEFVPAGKGYNYVAPLASRSTLSLDAAAVQGFNEWAFSFNKLMYNPQNETCDALRTKRAKIKTKRFSFSKRSVPLTRFPEHPFFKKISTRLRRDLPASRRSI